MKFGLTAISILLVLGAAGSFAQVDPGAEDWVFVNDIPPFEYKGWSGVTLGSGSATSDLFGRDPRTIQADAQYADYERHISVGVDVSREVDMDYLEHIVSDSYIDCDTGHFYPGASIVSLMGNVVYFKCRNPPDCLHRSYLWRTASNVVVSVNAGAGPDVRRDFTPGMPPSRIGKGLERSVTPEPTEVLQAYLQRYPSALTMFEDTDAHAHQWLLDEAALSLAAVEYKLAELDRGGDPERLTQHLDKFMRTRLLFTGGLAALRLPSSRKEEERLEAIDRMPEPQQVEQWRKVTKEYRDWWDSHIGQPIYVPSPPPPTAAPTVPPVTPSVAPTP